MSDTTIGRRDRGRGEPGFARAQGTPRAMADALGRLVDEIGRFRDVWLATGAGGEDAYLELETRVEVGPSGKEVSVRVHGGGAWIRVESAWDEPAASSSPGRSVCLSAPGDR